MKTNPIDNSSPQSTPATVAATTSGVRLGGLKGGLLKVHKDFHAPMTDDDLIPADSYPIKPVETIASRITVIRGQKVMIDADLAELYGVPTKVLNQAVKRNHERFPADFIFPLTAAEKLEVVTNCDHLDRLKFSRSMPFAFTEHGAIMTATVLSSQRAVEMSVYVVRAFVRLREVLASHKELAKRLDDLEQSTEALALRHEPFARNTRVQLKQVFDSIRELMTPQQVPPKRPIGFIHPEENAAKTRGRKAGR